MTKKSPPEGNISSGPNSLLCTLPRTTLLSKAQPAHQLSATTMQRTTYNPMGMACPNTTTQSMQVTVNPYSTYTPLMTQNNPLLPPNTPLIPQSTICDTDSESQYASVVYSSPTMTRRPRFNPGQSYSTTLSQGSRTQSQGQQGSYLSPQLARLNHTLRPPLSANGSPVHQRQSAMSSTSTLSTCLMSPRSGRFNTEDSIGQYPNTTREGTQQYPSYDPNLHHVYCEIPLSASKQQQMDRIRLQQQLRSKLFKHQTNQSSLTDENTEVIYTEDLTQCDFNNISDLSDDEFQNHTTFSDLSFQTNSKHSNNSPKHYNQQKVSRLSERSSPGHVIKKRGAFKQNQHVLSPPPLKNHTKDQISQLHATDV